jgi:predicted DNA-binding protein
MSVTLTEAKRNYLHEKYDDCVCVNCMEELRTGFHNILSKKINKIFGTNKL